MHNPQTPHFSLPLPHPDNLLQQDVLRLANALTAVDTQLFQQQHVQQQQYLAVQEKLRRSRLNQLLGEPLLAL
ncbi:hypothetical protein [Pseudoalteromonas rubra]|uniref:Uncharacterized protein n=1 Tax=Pseudoalteromonas rubra TaxID=43658 RepID=A0A0U2X9V6_9GAMM|nr:hypothetical protein [Pseudoalteromonas rubra]ALU44628.1 hypothetical protein AT705_17790 [Pseudoalteromonas rubra]